MSAPEAHRPRRRRADGRLDRLRIAQVIARLPEAWIIDPTRRAILSAGQVPAPPVFVLARAVARSVCAAERTVLLWSVAGALAFDGLARAPGPPDAVRPARC